MKWKLIGYVFSLPQWTKMKQMNALINDSVIIHHYHYIMPLARISLTLSRHFSLSFIASGWSSGLHPVSSHSCCMYVRAGRPAFARPYVGVHRSTSLMSLSLLLQLATFLCNYCLACSPAVLLTSKWCIHTAVSTRPLLGGNCVSFYRSGLTSKLSIAYR